MALSLSSAASLLPRLALTSNALSRPTTRLSTNIWRLATTSVTLPAISLHIPGTSLGYLGGYTQSRTEEENFAFEEEAQTVSRQSLEGRQQLSPGVLGVANRRRHISCVHIALQVSRTPRLNIDMNYSHITRNSAKLARTVQHRGGVSEKPEVTMLQCSTMPLMHQRSRMPTLKPRRSLPPSMTCGADF